MKTGNASFGKDGAGGTLNAAGEGEAVQPLCKTAWQFLKKLPVCLP